MLIRHCVFAPVNSQRAQLKTKAEILQRICLGHLGFPSMLDKSMAGCLKVLSLHLPPPPPHLQFRGLLAFITSIYGRPGQSATCLSGRSLAGVNQRRACRGFQLHWLLYFFASLSVAKIYERAPFLLLCHSFTFDASKVANKHVFCFSEGDESPASTVKL